MSIKDILLALISYPVSTTPEAIEAAVGFAKSLEARVSGITFELDIRSPIGLYADALNIRGILAAERNKCSANAREIVASFEAAAIKRSVTHDHDIERCSPVELASRLVAKARLRDITFFPLKEGDGNQQNVAEHLIFESGRPVMVFPDDSKNAFAGSLENIAVAWDFSRPSTRAMADAMPLLEAGKTVQIFTVVDDKPLHSAQPSSALAKHLATHGVEASFEEIKSNGRSIGDVFDTYVREHKIDLLVMGAYGHSRIRELVLGGATKSILARMPTWVLLSH